jgi:hypothetical protein
MFYTLLKELCSWLIETLGEHSIVATIETYLLSRGEVLMADCIHGTSQDLIEAAAEMDCLKWDSLLEGRISKQWLVVTSPFLRRSNKFCSHPHGAVNSSTNSTILSTSSGYSAKSVFIIKVLTPSHYLSTTIS